MELRPSALRRINVVLFAATLCALAFTCLEAFISEPQCSENKASSATQKAALPLLPRSFHQQQTQYDSIGPPFIALDTTKSSPKLPDLRAQLLYYGKNLRPDSTKDRSVVLLGIRGDQALMTAQSGDVIYLTLSNKNGMHRWAFNENNQPTPVSIMADCIDDEVAIQLSVTTQDGTVIKDPPDLASFRLREIPLPPMTTVSSGWHIGEHPVDNGYLAKLKTKWFGQDRFLTLYGGKEYEREMEKERIQFEGPDGEYAVFVKEQDTLSFIDGRWIPTALGEESIGNPLLVVKKVEERRILLDLWDEEGRRRITLEVGRTPDQHPNPQKLDLKLLGARSKSNWILSILGKRTPVRADDWILFQESGFKIISSEAEIDDYIQGRLKGSLLVLDDVEKDTQGTFLRGSLFSVSHAEMAQARIALQNQQDTKQQKPQEASAPHFAQPPFPKLPFTKQTNEQNEMIGEDENDPSDDDLQDEDIENHDIDYI